MDQSTGTQPEQVPEQAPMTPEETLAACRALLGIETPPIAARYPIEFEPIRRYCHSAWDDNPLFVDPDYARSGPYGAVICPPLGIRPVTVMPGGPLDSPFPPLDRSLPQLPPLPVKTKVSINLGVEWEFPAPVRVGDWLTETSRYSDFYLKATRADPKSIFWEVESTYRNQEGEIVAIARTLSMLHRTPDELRAAAEARGPGA